MPITLPPISRRRFLGTSLSAAAAMLAGCSHLGWREGGGADPNRLALVSDTHIHADKAYVHSDGNCPWENFRQVSDQITALSPRASAVLFCGDCVYLQGRPEDYATLVEAVKPLRKAKLPVHLALGNHDNRENFWRALPADTARQTDLADRQVLLVQAPNANVFMLDSLEVTNQTPGSLGEAQLAWLAKTLDAHADRPALVMLHHDPGKNAGSLRQPEVLLEVLEARKHVKACVFGHTHVWQHGQRGRLHFVNLPPTAWLFKANLPNGWVDLQLQPNGARFQLHTLKADHPQNGQTLDLTWA